MQARGKKGGKKENSRKVERRERNKYTVGGER
jgi:hypothetical protein